MILESEIVKVFENTFIEKGELTIGIEQEFFLLTLSGDPASPEAANAFWNALVSTGYYTALSTYEENIESISYKEASGRNTIIKFDHHPHLLEIATDYFSDLNELKKCLNFHLLNCEKAADNLALKVHFSPTLPFSAADERLHSDWPFYKNLRYYRTRWMVSQGLEPKAEIVNYAAVIAATQIHIGGVPFQAVEKLIEDLYSLEPYILALHLKNQGQPVLERLAYYDTVFTNSPLVSFPKMAHWSWKSYIDALQNTPLYGGVTNSWAGRTFNQLRENDKAYFENNPASFLSCVRDLQLIKPRTLGTLEFRADPAQPSLDYIMNLAALRLGFFLYITNKKTTWPFLLNHTRQHWDKIKEKRKAQVPLKNFYSTCYDALAQRKLREEAFLIPSFYEL